MKQEKRSRFELPVKDVTWLKRLEIQKQSTETIYSTRKRKPTRLYADETQLISEYVKMLKQHTKTYATIKDTNIDKKSY